MGRKKNCLISRPSAIIYYMADVSASDMELLRDYDRRGSEEAFAALVRRHLNLVYSVSLRHVGAAAQAEEITQAVFVILARQAGRFGPNSILEGWLHETARLTALSFLRGERRRRFREQEAYLRSTLEQSTEASVWPQLEPLLDEAISRLGEKDRAAVMLRFFKEQSLREVAAALKVNEAAAQRRVHRAVERLRRFLTKRGMVVPAAVLTAAISAHSVHAAPAAMAASVTTVALAKGAVAGGSTLTIIQGALKLMAWTKMKTVAGLAVATIAGISITTVALKHIQTKLVEVSYPGDWIWEANSQTLDRVPPLLVLRPSQLRAGWVPFEMFGKDRYLARGKTIQELLAAVYAQKNSQEKLTCVASLPNDKYDCCVVTTQPKWWDALESEIDARFNLVAQPDPHDGNAVLIASRGR
jgi:RNA polymerase sigma factor (sigma-70 family)